MQKKKSFWRLFILLLFAVSVVTCVRFFKEEVGNFLGKILSPSTPREAFLKKAKRNDWVSQNTLETWDSLYQSAKQDTLQIELPYREILALNNTLQEGVQAWRFKLPAGRRVFIRATNSSEKIFGDLYEISVDNINEKPSNQPISSLDTLINQLNIESGDVRTSNLLLLIQAMPESAVSYDLQIITQPVIDFPVAGKTAKSILSFWGDPRDGGRRKHEGNDIFAPRRTPLLAVVDGRISSTRGSNLGGKTIWLRDGEGRDLSYYYAHLDSQLVSVGDVVQRGDTIGLVGNTGNARFTPPHLHFGIYQSGAIDPFNFLNDPDRMPRSPQVAIEEKLKKVPQRGRHYLRTSPERAENIIRQLIADEEVTLLGSTARFYRVRTQNGELGYVNFD
ncbi:MAG: M23 family metallopeptidase [Bacteroidota bacterium]